MVYVVCQTKKCQQTHSIDSLGVITKDTKNVKCKKCGGVLIDENGRGNLSRLADVRPVYDEEEAKRKRKIELKQKREEMARLKKDIEILESEEVS